MAALEDGLERATACWLCKAGMVHGETLADSMLEWVEAENLDGVVTMAPFVGPTRDRMLGVEPAFVERGLRWIELRRAGDAAIHAKAMRGFFPFWKEVSREVAW